MLIKCSAGWFCSISFLQLFVTNDHNTVVYTHKKSLVLRCIRTRCRPTSYWLLSAITSSHALLSCSVHKITFNHVAFLPNSTNTSFKHHFSFCFSLNSDVFESLEPAAAAAVSLAGPAAPSARRGHGPVCPPASLLRRPHLLPSSLRPALRHQEGQRSVRRRRRRALLARAEAT